jgi:hypothetical protein
VSIRRGDRSSRRRGDRPVRGAPSRQIRPALLPVHGRALDERDALSFGRTQLLHRSGGALAFIASSPLGVVGRSGRDMLTSRTSARLPAFAPRLADRRRLRSSSSSAAESECAQPIARLSAKSEPRRDGAFERFQPGASLAVEGRSRSNSSSEKTECGKTLLRRRTHIFDYCEAKLSDDQTIESRWERAGHTRARRRPSRSAGPSLGSLPRLTMSPSESCHR